MGKKIKSIAGATLSVFLLSSSVSYGYYSMPKNFIATYFSAGQGQKAYNVATNDNPPLKDMNMVIIAFANSINSSNGATLEFGYDAPITRKVVEAIQARTNPNTNILMSIGAPNGVDINNTTFANNAANFLLSYHLQGLDLDIESNEQQILPLVKTLYPVFHKDGLLLTVSVAFYPENYRLNSTNISQFYNNVNYVEIQNYFMGHH